MDWLISIDIKVGVRGGDVKWGYMRALKMCKDPPAWGYTKTNLKNDDKKMNKDGVSSNTCYKPLK